MKPEHLIAIESAVNAVAEKKINHFFFVACGGSLAFMMPASFIFSREIEIPSSCHPANEFVHMQPKALGKDSVVITCSHSGTTPETVRATEYARKMGAATIALTHEIDSPLWKAAEYPLHYDWGMDADSSDLNKGVLYSLIFRILNCLNPSEKFEKGIRSIDGLEKAMRKVREQYKNITAEWGRKYKRESLIYSMGSGLDYGEVYSFSVCLLMEMQWINSNPIHSGEYFHGPFEITDYDVPFVIVKGLGSTRPLDERAYNFCAKYSEKIMVIDEMDFDLSDIDEAVRAYYAPLLTGAVLRCFADALAYERGHDLGVRRYMWKMEY